jgi:hypothetical protein
MAPPAGGTTTTATTIVPAPPRTTYDVNVNYPLTAEAKRAARTEASRADDTERRLRSVEEKLDRVLKALDATKPRPDSDGSRH